MSRERESREGVRVEKECEVRRSASRECYVPGVTRKEFRKPKFCNLESQQKALLKFNKIY